MKKPVEFEQQGPLYRVGLTSGLYEEVDLQKVTEVFGIWTVEDPDELLNKIINPSLMNPTDHAHLLQVLIKKGYRSADEKFAVGPVQDEDLKPLQGKMRVVFYESAREKILPL